VSAGRHAPGRRVRAGAMRATGLALALILGGIWLGACATTQPAISYEQIDQRKQEITMLWSQIRGWRQDAGLRGVEPPPRAILEMRGKTTAQAARVCPQRVQAQTQVCTDVCSLADAICENADRICRIADELEDDAWADGKCSSAKASCKEARQACCRCWSEEAPAADRVPPASGNETGSEPGTEPGTTPDGAGAARDQGGNFFWTQVP
jgi:hypothetical protein